MKVRRRQETGFALTWLTLTTDAREAILAEAFARIRANPSERDLDPWESVKRAYRALVSCHG